MPPDGLTREERIGWLQSEIAYERHRGIHTYHTCPYCGEHPTRAGKCARCLEEDLAAVAEQHALTCRSAEDEGSNDGTV